MMSSGDRINKKNGLWRRMSDGFSLSSISRSLRSFRSALICGKPSDVASSPVYTGPLIVHVPWSGETYQYREDRYLSNGELKSQLTESRRFDGLGFSLNRKFVCLTRVTTDTSKVVLSPVKLLLSALLRSGTCCVLIFILNLIVPYVLGTESTSPDMEEGYMDIWFIRLFVNLLGYATIFVPGYLLIRYMRKVRYDETAGPGFFQQLAKLCVFGKEHEHNLDSPSGGKKSETTDASQNVLLLVFCFFGLQGAYLTWGLLQERIMTFNYGETATSKGEQFKNSQFLVFINRILAFCIGILVLFVKKQPPHTAPLYKYSYSSFSNIMSSWFQYEALKFVSFPTQVLAKACKVIPVMLMGKVVSKKTYEYYEYITAIMISMGVGMFLLTSGDVTRSSEKTTTIVGFIMLVGYMLFDSFTSNWQGELFKQYKMSSIQMMAGVNMFSCLLTSVSLIEQGGFVECIAFMFSHPTFIVHAVVLSLCSACGQLFIFYTIEKFGPVTFTIIMTLRQAFAILLSCIIYGHPLTFVGIIGVMVVFAALFIRIYANQRARALKLAREAAERNSSNV